MNISRRVFCGASVGALSSGIVGRSFAQSEVTVTGSLTTEADADVGGTEVRLSNVETRDRAETILDSSGGDYHDSCGTRTIQSDGRRPWLGTERVTCDLFVP